MSPLLMNYATASSNSHWAGIKNASARAHVIVDAASSSLTASVLTVRMSCRSIMRIPDLTSFVPLVLLEPPLPSGGGHRTSTRNMAQTSSKDRVAAASPAGGREWSLVEEAIGVVGCGVRACGVEPTGDEMLSELVANKLDSFVKVDRSGASLSTSDTSTKTCTGSNVSVAKHNKASASHKRGQSEQGQLTSRVRD